MLITGNKHANDDASRRSLLMDQKAKTVCLLGGGDAKELRGFCCFCCLLYVSLFIFRTGEKRNDLDIVLVEGEVT